MNITRHTLINEFKDFFHSIFPFLKLEIYDVKSENFNGTNAKIHLSDKSLLIDLNPQLINHHFDIDSQMEVGKFEKMMLELYNLNVQVFRQSSGLWLQTTATDHWSLEKQNSKGEHSMNEHNIPPLNVTDFDLN